MRKTGRPKRWWVGSNWQKEGTVLRRGRDTRLHVDDWSSTTRNTNWKHEIEEEDANEEGNGRYTDTECVIGVQ